MRRKFHKSLIAGILCLNILASFFGNAYAQGNSSMRAEDYHPTVPSQIGDVVSFAQLLQDDIRLTGPFDSEAVLFDLPLNWRLAGGAYVDLSMTVAFNTTAFDQTDLDNLRGPAGTITLEFNDTVIGVISLDKVGEASYRISIPLETMVSARDDGRMELRFYLDSGWSCYLDENMLIFIHKNSSLTLPHETTAPDLNLLRFPAPIFQEYAIYKPATLVVIPDNPSAAELQSALTIASGLGDISSRTLDMDLIQIGQLTTQQIENNNLILVGKAAMLPISSAGTLSLPIPVAESKFVNTNGADSDGIIQLVQSPWNSDNAILIASGNTDEGTIKSAQALSAGALRPGTPANNVAIVDKVMPAPARYTYEVDQTFADLGYRTAEMNDIGVNYESYEFYIPHGQTVTEEAYLDLLFGHSALIQYDNSGIVIRLNGKPIGSIALTAQSAQQSINRVRVQIPKEAVISGVNEIELRVNLDPVDRCTNPDLEGIYANIWPESLLHLPLTQGSVPAELNFNLNLFPAPFQYTPSLETTAFVLQNDDFNTWREVFKVAAYLGDVTNGYISTFKTYFGDNVPEEERGNYNFIVVGRPSQMPFMAELNEYLPAPFETGSDLASEPQMQVEFRINPSTPVGYVELFPSPWNDENVIVAALGNTEKGIFWAVSHLIEPLSWDMAGNFTAISDKQVFTADTRLSILTPNIISEGDQELVVEALPPSIVEDDFAPPPAYRPAWLLPAIEGSIVLIGIIIVAVLITGRSRKRSHK